jgi:hypothetical protein
MILNIVLLLIHHIICQVEHQLLTVTGEMAWAALAIYSLRNVKRCFAEREDKLELSNLELADCRWFKIEIYFLI